MKPRLRWVRRDPCYRELCPRCHANRVWPPGRSYGPRTTLRCEPCGVRWKTGGRPLNFRFTQRLMWRLSNQNISTYAWMRSDGGKRW